MKIKFLIMLLVVSVLSAPVIAGVWDPNDNWSILNETYGNGAGQMSAINAFAWPWSDTPTEALFDGYAQLTHGAGIDYAGRLILGTGIVIGNNWRVDLTMQLQDSLGATIFLPNNIVSINWLWDDEGSASADVIGNYNGRGGNIAPVGFDGSAVHTYRFISRSGAVAAYVDDYFLGILTNGSGAIGDGYQFIIGFGAGLATGPGVSQLFSVKASTDTYVPVLMCGDPGTVYLPRDYNRDCYVNLGDLAEFIGDWLKCSDPAVPDCDQYWL